MNGYTFSIPDDAPDFTKSVAERCLDNREHSTSEEVARIARWLAPNLGQSRIMRLFYYLSRRRRTSMISLLIWVIGFILWNETALARMKELGR